VTPAREAGRKLGAEAVLADQHAEDLGLKDTGHGACIQVTDRQAPSVARPDGIRDKGV